MELKNFVKNYNRMCEMYEDCCGCPLQDKEFSCNVTEMKDENVDEVEEIVKNWADEHPEKTNADMVKETLIELFGNKLGSELFYDLDILQGGCTFLRCPSSKPACHECKYNSFWSQVYKEP